MREDCSDLVRHQSKRCIRGQQEYRSGLQADGKPAEALITELTSAIVAAGGPHYDYREIDPVADQDGGQPGGNIRVAFLFDQKRVSFVDTGAGDVNRSTTGTEIV